MEIQREQEDTLWSKLKIPEIRERERKKKERENNVLQIKIKNKDNTLNLFFPPPSRQ